ncbi:hypothetical protein SDJN03_27721, partial [Cucurbita argyrosperma subsp. sororia]
MQFLARLEKNLRGIFFNRCSSGFSEGVLADIEGAQDLAARSSVLLQCWYFVSFYVLFALMFAAGWNRMWTLCERSAPCVSSVSTRVV